MSILKAKLAQSGKWVVRTIAIAAVGLLAKVDSASAAELVGSNQYNDGQYTDQIDYIDEGNVVYGDPNDPPPKPE